MKKKAFFLISAVIITAGPFFLCCTARNNVPAGNTKIGMADKAQPYFLFLSDIHLATDRMTTSYGEDAGTELWNIFQAKIESTLNSSNPPAFILYTGDMPEHGGSADTSRRNKNIDTVLLNLHAMSAKHKIPIFYVAGNNDALSNNYCLFSDSSGRTPFSLVRGFSPYPFQAFNVPDTFTPLSRGAYMLPGGNMTECYYAVQVMKGLRLIGLNSVLWSSQLCENCPADCDSQKINGDAEMAWLEQQLGSADSSGDKVYLAMHVPPGIDAYQSRNHPDAPIMMWRTFKDSSDWQHRFLKMITAYKRTVAGVFFGHTHMDEFRLLYNPAADTIVQVAISCPGISVRSYNNPGFKLVKFDPESKLPTDFITYYTTINPIVWQPADPLSHFKMLARGSSVYERLKQTSPENRKLILDSIYSVKHGMVSYDTLGLNVK